MESTKKKRIAVVAGGLILLFGGGIAFAAYLSSGSGSGETRSSVAANSVISPDTPGAQLFPGGSTTYTVKVSNPNPYPVTVLSLSMSSSDATATCPAATVTSPTVTNPPGTPATIAPNGGTSTYSLTATMIKNPDNGCQNQTFTMPLTAQIASAAG